MRPLFRSFGSTWVCGPSGLLPDGGGIGWYARAGYFVGVAGRRIMIYQGRPGGVLWFRPTVAADPGRWGSAALAVGCVVLAVVALRMHQTSGVAHA